MGKCYTYTRRSKCGCDYIEITAFNFPDLVVLAKDKGINLTGDEYIQVRTVISEEERAALKNVLKSLGSSHVRG